VALRKILGLKTLYKFTSYPFLLFHQFLVKQNAASPVEPFSDPKSSEFIKTKG